jgi:hypothetical protein
MIRAITAAIVLAGLIVAAIWLNSGPPDRPYVSPWQGGGGTIP